mgnify:CR=1 FL=1
MTPTDRCLVFRRLHESGCFVIPNPWDLGSARLLAGMARDKKGVAHNPRFVLPAAAGRIRTHVEVEPRVAADELGVLLYFLVQPQDAVEERLGPGRAAGHEDVHGEQPVDALVSKMPPELAHEPMASTHLGSGICS